MLTLAQGKGRETCPCFAGDNCPRGTARSSRSSASGALECGWSNRNAYATTFPIRSNPFVRLGSACPRPSTLTMPKDVDARANPQTESGTRVVVKRSPPEDARDDENPNCTACARSRYVARVGGPDPGRTGGGSERRSGGSGVHGLCRNGKDHPAGRPRQHRAELHEFLRARDDQRRDGDG